MALFVNFVAKLLLISIQQVLSKRPVKNTPQLKSRKQEIIFSMKKKSVLSLLSLKNNKMTTNSIAGQKAPKKKSVFKVNLLCPEVLLYASPCNALETRFALTRSSPRVDSASSSGSPGAWMVTDLSARLLLSRLLERCLSLRSLKTRDTSYFIQHWPSQPANTLSH